jgi:hypothetical protein
LQDSPIQIGPISLQDFEIPQSVRFGGRQRVKVHTLAGGRRVVERLGPDDDAIRFRGTFTGSEAEDRARTFDNLRLSGEIISLTWKSFRRQVIVKSFAADFHSPWWIPYQASCIVVDQTDLASATLSVIEALLSSDLARASLGAVGAGIPLTSLQTALATSNGRNAITSNQTQAIAAVGTTLDVIDGFIAVQSAMLLTPIRSSEDLGCWSRAYADKVTRAGSLAFAVNTRSYVGRIAMNLNGPGD